MKKLLRSIATGFALAGFITVPAFAQSSISNTGPGSTNTITHAQQNNNTFTCINTSGVINLNTQIATTGTASVDNNTNAGSATSGNASNSNNTTTSISQGCGQSTTDGGNGGNGGSGGQGGGTTSQPSASQGVGGSGAVLAASITALPATGEASKSDGVKILALTLGGLTAVSQVGASVFRRMGV